MHAKMKELGSIGGHVPGMPPRSANVYGYIYTAFTLHSASAIWNVNKMTVLLSLCLIWDWLRLLDGVRSIFPVWREPWSTPGQSFKTTHIRLVW